MNGPESIFYKLLLKKISGALTEEEKLLLADLLKAYPEFSEAYETVQWLWNEADVSSLQRGPERSKRLLERNLQQLKQEGLLPENTDVPAAGPVKSRKRRYYLLGAGLLVLTACITLLFSRQSEEVTEIVEKRYPNMVITRPGSRTKLILPDGSTVWLNASSKLTYSDDFMQKERRVHLDGEAYFEVVKNEGKPFVINTSVMDVRVLGTTLNVKSYPGEKKAEAVLIRGKIEVQVKRRPQERYLLSSYEKLSIIASEPGIHQQKELSISSVAPAGRDSAIAETAWVANELVFNGEPLSELAVRMERWFDLRITVTGTRLRSFRMTGAFKDDSPEEALKAISMITGCKYRLKDHTAVLYDAN